MGHAGTVANITASPPALVAARQPGQTITIINYGPITVWLSGDQSIAPGYGYKLPPGEDVGWPDAGPVYAATYAHTGTAPPVNGSVDVLVGPP